MGSDLEIGGKEMLGEGKLFDLRKTCLALYGAYGAAILMQFFEQAMMPGLLLMVIAFIITRDRRAAAKGTPYESHLRWLTRTFWIGTGVVMPLAIVVATALILQFTDISSIATSDPDALMSGISNYIYGNMSKIMMLSSVSMIPTAVWWLHRCWIGFALARDEEPVKNVTTWL